MQVDLKKFLEQADIQESFYPGKRIVKPCKQTGEYKSHCVVLDWRDPENIHIEVKAGLSGKHLAPENLKHYPVCFQMPTYINIKVVNDNKDDDEDEDDTEEGKSKGKSGGGSKKPAKKKKLENIALISDRFSQKAEGQIPARGKIMDMVVLGVQMAKDTFDAAFSELTKQISHAKVSATEILAKTSDFVTRVTPPGFLKPRGDETQKYKYDREKNADIGMLHNRPGLG